MAADQQRETARMEPKPYCRSDRYGLKSKDSATKSEYSQQKTWRVSSALSGFNLDCGSPPWSPRDAFCF